jgi:hypothetical protein
MKPGTFVSSNPQEWMRPYYEAVASQGFAHLAIPLKFAAFVEAIAADYPTKAAKLREILDLPSQQALLGSMANIAYTRPAERGVELWLVTRDGNELRCVAVYLPTGIDLRLLDADGFRRTQLLRFAQAVEARAQEWHERLAERGWR